MARTRAFVGLGANEAEPLVRMASALERIERSGARVASVSRCVRGPYRDASGPVAGEPPVWNAVAEVHAAGGADAFHRLLHEVEGAEGRARDGRLSRSIDLDLLTYGDETRATEGLALPHPRALDRAFVLAPWEEIEPLAVVPATDATVLDHAARLRATSPEAFGSLEPAGRVPLPSVGSSVTLLEDRSACATWRASRSGTVGVVMTMGALHEGHGALVRRARAECDAVLATIFVNPLQFGPNEDFGRYPRTLDDDLRVLSESGADAVYVPSREDLYPPGFSTHVDPPAPAAGYEGSVRPGHFRGVTTVVAKLWRRTRPSRAYFGRKDAQQLAVVSRMVRDLDLSGDVVPCAIVRAADGLALSSRNRYLSPPERSRALALPRALEALVSEAVRGERRDALLAAARVRWEAAELTVDYVDLVDPETMTPVDVGQRPAIAVAAVRVGTTRLLDNRFVAVPSGKPRTP